MLQKHFVSGLGISIPSVTSGSLRDSYRSVGSVAVSEPFYSARPFKDHLLIGVDISSAVPSLSSGLCHVLGSSFWQCKVSATV